MLWVNLMTMHAKWRCYALTQEIRTIKTLTSAKSATVDKFTTNKHKKQCWIFRSLWQNKKELIR